MAYWIFLAVIAGDVLWQLGTGKAGKQYGGFIRREENPKRYWAAISCESGLIVVVLLFRYVFHITK
jgi:hypothetical protein